jgi:hypothetical protein
VHDLPIASFLSNSAMRRQFPDADAAPLAEALRTVPAEYRRRRVRVAIAEALNRAAGAVAPSPDCSPLR